MVSSMNSEEIKRANALCLDEWLDFVMRFDCVPGFFNDSRRDAFVTNASRYDISLVISLIRKFLTQPDGIYGIDHFRLCHYENLLNTPVEEIERVGLGEYLQQMKDLPYNQGLLEFKDGKKDKLHHDLACLAELLPDRPSVFLETLDNLFLKSLQLPDLAFHALSDAEALVKTFIIEGHIPKNFTLIRKLSHFAFEDFAMRYYKDKGFKVTPTPKTRDRGVDLGC